MYTRYVPSAKCSARPSPNRSRGTQYQIKSASSHRLSGVEKHRLVCDLQRTTHAYMHACMAMAVACELHTKNTMYVCYVCYVRLLCMSAMNVCYVRNVCRLCMSAMYVCYVCLPCMSAMYVCHVCRQANKPHMHVSHYCPHSVSILLLPVTHSGIASRHHHFSSIASAPKRRMQRAADRPKQRKEGKDGPTKRGSVEIGRCEDATST